VHVADVFDHERLAEPDGPVPAQVDLEYLGEIGLQGRLEGWRNDAQAAERKVAC
jgi:hypothetical protein